VVVTVTSFLKDHCKRLHPGGGNGPVFRVGCVELFASYEEYCRKHQVPACGYIQFCQQVGQGFPVKMWGEKPEFNGLRLDSQPNPREPFRSNYKPK